MDWLVESGTSDQKRWKFSTFKNEVLNQSVKEWTYCEKRIYSQTFGMRLHVHLLTCGVPLQSRSSNISRFHLM